METGIGSWTEDQIVDAIRNARRPDGTFMGPPMSFGWYKNMSDTDVRAIAKYVEVGAGRAQRGPGKHVSDGAERPPSGQHLWADRHDRPRRAEDRHREIRRVPRGARGPLHGLPHDVRHGTDRHGQIGRGGNVYSRPFIYDWAAVSANITPHPEAGLGAWSDDEIKRAITKGISRDGRQLLPFMPYWLYDKMEPGDLDAIVAYLRSLPPQGPAAPAVPEYLGRRCSFDAARYRRVPRRFLSRHP